MIDKLSYMEPKNKPEQLVVFLHGFGSNKDDLISLSEEFKTVLPNALFISPNAPNQCDFMYDGYNWFSLDGVDLQNKIVPDSVKKELYRSIDDLNSFIDKIIEEYNIPKENLYLIGFSQGATMSIYTALSRETPVRGVLSYSGICFDSVSIKSKPNVIGLSHGGRDDVVPFFWHKENLNLLKNNNLNVKELVVNNAYHEIPLEAIEFGKKILKESL